MCVRACMHVCACMCVCVHVCVCVCVHVCVYVHVCVMQTVYTHSEKQSAFYVLMYAILFGDFVIIVYIFAIVIVIIIWIFNQSLVFLFELHGKYTGLNP